MQVTKHPLDSNINKPNGDQNIGLPQLWHAQVLAFNQSGPKFVRPFFLLLTMAAVSRKKYMHKPKHQCKNSLKHVLYRIKW
jgi:hypothetical protein